MSRLKRVEDVLKGRSRRQVSVPVRRQEPPLTNREIRTYFARIAGMVAFCGAIYWVGWKSPWARADMRVRVEAVDAPKAAAAPVAAPDPAATAATEPAGAERPETTADREEQEPARARRRHRRSTRRTTDEQD